MRILLVSPRWEGVGNRKKVKVREARARPLTLGILAALCPPGHEVRIVDEHAGPIPYSPTWDLVGITCTTYRAPRAYAIAGLFKTLGVPVVMGGVHPTLQPRECLKHCSAVVRGEAEPVWARVLDDAARGELEPIYEGGVLEDLSQIPIPRRDLYGPPRQNPAYLQATRGCGWKCRFCYLQDVGWGAFRGRPIDHVVAELRATEAPVVALVDDNLFVNRRYALDLLGELRGLGKHWWAQAPSTVCMDDELLEAAKRSGCFALSIGFQTIHSGSLKQARVGQNRIDRYCAQVHNVRRHRILVDSTWIFGFDDDPPTIFGETAEAIQDMGVDAYSLYFLTAYPGTPEYDRIEAEGRIVERDLARFDWDHPVVRPRLMSTDDLARGVAQAYQRLDGSALRWLVRSLTRNQWLPRSEPYLAAYLLSNTFYQPYRVDY